MTPVSKGHTQLDANTMLFLKSLKIKTVSWQTLRWEGRSYFSLESVFLYRLCCLHQKVAGAIWVCISVQTTDEAKQARMYREPKLLWRPN